MLEDEERLAEKATSVNNRLDAGFETFDFGGASVILEQSTEWPEVVDVLNCFQASHDDLIAPGGGKSDIAYRLNEPLKELGWTETTHDIALTYEGEAYHYKTHRLDAFKGRVGLEIEWNNKDTFYDRDLSAFRLMHSAGLIDCGIIVTRSTDLFPMFRKLVAEGRLQSTKYVTTTTHMDRLIPRVISGGAGDCPIFAVGITQSFFSESNQIDFVHQNRA
jgi:hypothetical protein